MEQLLALEMVRVTEAAAIASARLMGRGDRDGADQAAVEAMRKAMDEPTSPARSSSARASATRRRCSTSASRWATAAGRCARVDIAVDPLEGRTSSPTARPNAITGPRGVRARRADARPGHVPREALRRAERRRQGHIDARRPPRTSPPSPRRSAATGGHHGRDPRPAAPRGQLIAEVRAAGARIKLIGDGDLSAAINCAVSGTGVHAVMGIGGAPEGVLAAAALKLPRRRDPGALPLPLDEERERAREMGHDRRERVYRTEDLASGRNVVFCRHRRHARRAPPGRPLLRRRRAHPLARDGVPDQAGPLRRHRPHVRPDRPRRPAGGQPSASGGTRRGAR
jgi:fructose-1,6-bisphosphatase II